MSDDVEPTRPKRRRRRRRRPFRYGIDTHADAPDDGDYYDHTPLRIPEGMKHFQNYQQSQYNRYTNLQNFPQDDEYSNQSPVDEILSTIPSPDYTYRSPDDYRRFAEFEEEIRWEDADFDPYYIYPKPHRTEDDEFYGKEYIRRNGKPPIMDPQCADRDIQAKMMRRLNTSSRIPKHEIIQGIPDLYDDLDGKPDYVHPIHPAYTFSGMFSQFIYTLFCYPFWQIKSTFFPTFPTYTAIKRYTYYDIWKPFKKRFNIYQTKFFQFFNTNHTYQSWKWALTDVIYPIITTPIRLIFFTTYGRIGLFICLWLYRYLPTIKQYLLWILRDWTYDPLLADYKYDLSPPPPLEDNNNSNDPQHNKLIDSVTGKPKKSIEKKKKATTTTATTTTEGNDDDKNTKQEPNSITTISNGTQPRPSKLAGLFRW